MPKCSCGVVSGDCYDACGARESKISSLIVQRDEALIAESRAIAELARVREEHARTLESAVRRMNEALTERANFEIALVGMTKERDAAAADSERLEWALPILTGADSDDADKLAMKLALALMRGLDGRAAIDFARKEC